MSDLTRQDEASLLVIVVSYAEKSETLRIIAWLTELVEQPDLAMSVRAVVWDNRAHGLQQRQSAVRYVSSPQGNIGFGAAVNQVARAVASERLLLLNSDIELDLPLFRMMIDRLASVPDEAIWAPVLLNADGSVQTDGTDLFLRSPWQEVLDIWGRPAARPITRVARHYLRGAVLSIPTRHFERVGGFDHEFFLYGEEADLCYRLPECELVIDREVAVVHLGSQGVRGKSPAALRYSLRARVLLQRRYNGWFAGTVTQAAAAAYIAILRVVRHRQGEPPP